MKIIRLVTVIKARNRDNLFVRQSSPLSLYHKTDILRCLHVQMQFFRFKRSNNARMIDIQTRDTYNSGDIIPKHFPAPGITERIFKLNNDLHFRTKCEKVKMKTKAKLQSKRTRLTFISKLTKYSNYFPMKSYHLIFTHQPLKDITY